ncbi:DUF2334 domain-containing protein [Paenibacillus filicis]|uniref:DUF2334 domain-containing protein n=1 Tax=Paenibacillus gyeongsangnamensis TaxID=3388067 RepID=A0ABT4Q9N4_9BACL|nr:DUF2334 domain-containing protein [Paenibacillus filicis]MCZ8513539.1 DUF2334 domain-containing protein [Paenibacillus filicis]
MGWIHKVRWIRYAVSAVIIGLSFTAYHIITVEGEGRSPKFVLIRLEDIGPGGQYDSIDQVGKLRAVLEYLGKDQTAYHLAVIPRWINMPADRPVYDVRLDQPHDAYAEAFRTVLHQAVERGATLGMHGYTHQVGSVRRGDGQHESGIGNEFNVPGSDETLTAAYAEPRLKEGLAILQHAGLKPQFWEAPHYRSTPQQDQLFRTYFGLNYQADVQANRNAPTAQFTNTRNTGSGVPTLGAAYVPTPFDYIPSNRDEKIITDRVGKSNHLASFYFHPFIDFKNLVPVLNEDGEPVLRDGIPEYRYADLGKSTLHKLITGLKAKGYTFYSIQDYIPFTPAHSVPLQPNTKLMLEDADGDGQADWIGWNTKTGAVTVQPGRFGGFRNEEQPAPAVWGQADYVKGTASAVSGKDAAGLCSLWTIQPGGRLARLVSDGTKFHLGAVWKTEDRTWDELFAMLQPDGSTLLAGITKDRMQLSGWLIQGTEMKTLKPFRFRSEVKGEFQVRHNGGTSLFISKANAVDGLEVRMEPGTLQWKVTKLDLGIPSEDGWLRFGDFNGDGREDVLRWNPATTQYTVYLKGGDGEWNLLSTLGPWGRANDGSQLLIHDMDGNGKSDLVLLNRTDGYADLALSFENGKLPAP